MGNRTSTLAEFVAGFRWEDLPEIVRGKTLELVHDGAGALVAAANPAFSTGRLIAAFVRGQGGAEQATVVGHGFRTSTVMTALANGTMGYACDVEPHHPEGILHPIAVMVPTALAVGELTGATGAQFLGAVALGLEVEYRVSIALGPAEQYALGFHPSAICGTFGAAAAAAFLLQLPAEAVGRAFGLAACQTSGLMAWESDPTENARPFQMGLAARNGVTAALLAQAGFGGPADVFDEGHTIFHAYSRAARPERLVGGLGTDWHGITEMAIKPYPCVSFLHPGLDALLGLVAENDLRPENIEGIRLRFPRAGIHCVDDNPLKSHCARYILPVAVANRQLKVADIFIDRRIGNPMLSALCRKVVVESDAELDRLFPDFYASIVEVTTTSGDLLTRRNDIARGYPESPLSPRELQEKFATMAGSVLEARVVGLLDDALHTLASAPNLGHLAVLLGTPAKGPAP